MLALVAAGLVAAALGFITSFLVLRGSDLSRLMVTLGVALMLGEIANRFSNITGGADGLQGVDIAPIFGLFRFDMFGHTGYIYSLVVLFVCFVIARRMVYSPFGLSLRALKGNALRAAAIGIPVNRRLVAIYTVSAGMAGMAGALLTQTTAFCSLDVFSLERSADLLLVLIIGGTGYLYGGLIGAVIYKFLQDWIASLTPQYWQFWIGLRAGGDCAHRTRARGGMDRRGARAGRGLRCPSHRAAGAIGLGGPDMPPHQQILTAFCILALMPARQYLAR